MIIMLIPLSWGVGLLDLTQGVLGRSSDPGEDKVALLDQQIDRQIDPQEVLYEESFLDTNKEISNSQSKNIESGKGSSNLEREVDTYLRLKNLAREREELDFKLLHHPPRDLELMFAVLMMDQQISVLEENYTQNTIDRLSPSVDLKIPESALT